MRAVPRVLSKTLCITSVDTLIGRPNMFVFTRCEHNLFDVPSLLAQIHFPVVTQFAVLCSCFPGVHLLVNELCP